jgi:Bacteriocin-protection, YdeI or OmpD-Associated/Domain of unknown function (DUF1905)
MSVIAFQAELSRIAKTNLLRIPQEVSSNFPSRNPVMIKGAINDYQFRVVLEPDGKKGHWLEIDEEMLGCINAAVGDTVNMEVEVIKDWIEPKVPDDLKKALDGDKEAGLLWVKITPMARFEWVRWINSTNNEDTRRRRIEVSISKLGSGKRRPCCFNTSQCTVPSVSKNGILLDF